jgi:TP901 family phage tail tape measure protein
MNSFLKVAVMLTAYDQMSRTIRDAVNKSKKELNDLKSHATNMFAQGFGLMGAGQAGFGVIGKTISDFEQLEDSAKSLKSAMMQDGGILNAAEFAKMNKLAEELGNRMPGNTADFNNMFTVMKNQGVPVIDILNGQGEAAASLAVALKLPYEEAGKMAAKLKEATGVGSKEMIDFMDVIARTANLGVDATEMQYSFARSAGTLKLMNIQGLEASKSLSAVYAMLIRTGASGETVGTGMSAVFNSMMNSDKMEKLNAATSKFGISMDFVDKKTGQFKGIENMMVQFEKMKNLNSADRAGIVQAFLGPGADANFMNTLINQGVAGFNKTTEAMSKQAKLQDKVNEQLSSLKNRKEAMIGTIQNMSAALGATLAPALGKIFDLIGKLAAKIQEFVSHNPRIAKLIMLLVAFTSAALMIAGVIRIVQGIIAVFKVLNIVMAMNPFILLAMVAISAVALIITFWDDIKAFFIHLWEKLKAIFIQAAKDITFILAHLNPYTLIYIYWDQISAFFLRVWNRVKGVFSTFINWVKNIGKPFFDAGRNIAVSIWNGIKSMANKPIEAIQDIVKSMRDYLPFSPAKRGPFKDLHRIKIVETIAASMKANPLIQSMQGIIGQALGVKTGGGFAGSSGSGGGIQITYAPVIHIGAGASKEDFLNMLKEHKTDLERFLNDLQARKKARKF